MGKNINIAIFALLIALVIPSFFFSSHIASEALRLDSDFSYTTNVESVDNFYDPEKGGYVGEINSKTIFSYEVIDQIDDVLIFKNLFDVKTPEGEPIFNVEREYGIDRETSKHVAGFGDRDRSGYLFAPQNITEKNRFDYWHVNYNDPAPMEFVSEEELFVLNTFKYAAEFQTDQTDNLGHLPGVPDERGVRLDVKLTTWIEPVTGSLINYQDSTEAYYYDIETGEKIHPWNTFSNTLNEASVVENVKRAQAQILDYENTRTSFLLVVLSFILFLLLLALATARYGLHLIVSLSSIVAAAGCAIMFGWFFDIEILKSLIPGLVTMKFTTALSFFVSGVMVIFLYRNITYIKKNGREDFYSSIIVLLSVLVLLLFMFTLLASSVLGFRVGVEELFVSETGELVQTTAPGRPSIGTMISFVLVSIVALLSVAQKRVGIHIFFGGLFVVLLGGVSLLGYIVDNPVLYWTIENISTAMALHTSILFILIGVAVALYGHQYKKVFGKKINTQRDEY